MCETKKTAATMYIFPKTFFTRHHSLADFFSSIRNSQFPSKNRLPLLLLACISSLSLSAQNEARRWAIDVNGGPTFIKCKSDYRDAFGVDNGTAVAFGVEYYIPHSHFSTRFGYKKETVNLIAQDVQAEHNLLSFGGRWYPAPEKWIFQPRMGVNMEVLLAADNTSFTSGTNSITSYAFDASIKSPKVTFAPTAGFDLYLLSSVAFTVDYSYGLGIKSRYEIFDGPSKLSKLITKGHLDHHNLSFGIKVTFPFRFNYNDADNLINFLFQSLYEKAKDKAHKHIY